MEKPEPPEENHPIWVMSCKQSWEDHWFHHLKEEFPLCLVLLPAIRSPTQLSIYCEALKWKKVVGWIYKVLKNVVYALLFAESLLKIIWVVVLFFFPFIHQERIGGWLRIKWSPLWILFAEKHKAFQKENSTNRLIINILYTFVPRNLKTFIKIII